MRSSLDLPKSPFRRESAGVIALAVVFIIIFAVLSIFATAWLLMLVLGALGFTFWSFWMCLGAVFAFNLLTGGVVRRTR